MGYPCQRACSSRVPHMKRRDPHTLPTVTLRDGTGLGAAPAEEASREQQVQYPRTIYTDLIRLICNMQVTKDRLVPCETAVLFERSAEVGQDPQRQQIDAQE